MCYQQNLINDMLHKHVIIYIREIKRLLTIALITFDYRNKILKLIDSRSFKKKVLKNAIEVCEQMGRSRMLWQHV